MRTERGHDAGIQILIFNSMFLRKYQFRFPWKNRKLFFIRYVPVIDRSGASAADHIIRENCPLGNWNPISSAICYLLENIIPAILFACLSQFLLEQIALAAKKRDRRIICPPPFLLVHPKAIAYSETSASRSCPLNNYRNRVIAGTRLVR